MRGDSFHNIPRSPAVYGITIINVSLICQPIKIKGTGLHQADGRA